MEEIKALGKVIVKETEQTALKYEFESCETR